jgi:hypothetical protein
MTSELFKVVPESALVTAQSHPVASNKRTILSVSVILISLISGYFISSAISAQVIEQQRFTLQTSGIVELSEEELLQVARNAPNPIYWSGPISGYSYLLKLDENGSSLLEYVAPESLDSKQASSVRQVATYFSKGAWEKSLVASNAAGFSSFKNSDGSLVFYSIDNANDVFMAFPNKDFQIEIFDNRAGQALSLSVLDGQIRQIS